MRFQAKKSIVGACVSNTVYLHNLFQDTTKIATGVVVSSDRTRYGGHVWIVREGRVIECSHEWNEEGVMHMSVSEACRVLDLSDESKDMIIKHIEILGHRAKFLRRLSWERYVQQALESKDKTLSRRAYIGKRLEILDSGTDEEKGRAMDEMSEYINSHMK